MACYQLDEEVMVQDAVFDIWYPATVTGCTNFRIRLSDWREVDVPTSQMRTSSKAVIQDQRILQSGTIVEALTREWQPATVVCGVMYTTSYAPTTQAVKHMHKRNHPARANAGAAEHAQSNARTSSLFRRSVAGRCNIYS
jgi:hypothetical protein